MVDGAKVTVQLAISFFSVGAGVADVLGIYLVGREFYGHVGVHVSGAYSTLHRWG